MRCQHSIDDDEAYGIVNRLLDAVPSGSYLVIGHPTTEVHGEAMTEAMRLWNEQGGTPIVARNRKELARFFDRIELLEPGVVSCSRWRPEPADPEPAEVSEFCLESFYEVPRERVAELVRAILAFPSVVVLDPTVLLRALEIYETDRLDFAEGYLVAQAERSGVGVVASFDKAIDRVATVRRLEPA